MYDKHLDLFITAAECGSFSKAAEKAFISPNAVIKQINLLENELGVTLFRRSNHGIELTEAGKIILHGARQIIKQSNLTIEKAKAVEKSSACNIRIGTSLLRPCKTIVELWSTIREDYPQMNLQIVPFDDSYRNWLSVLDNLGKDIDIVAGIYPSSYWHSDCKILDVTTYPLCLAVPDKHALAKRELLTLNDLHGETLIMVERGDTAYIDALRDDIEQNHPQIHLQNVPSYDTEIFNQCEISGCPMVTISTWAELHPSLVTIPCDWNYSVPFGIIYSSHPTEKVQLFLEAIKRVLL